MLKWKITQMKNIYQKMYSDEKNLGSLGENPRIRIMLEIVDSLNLQEKNILDIGCYDGSFLAGIKNRSNNFYGLEASDWGVKKSRENNVNVAKYFFNDVDGMPYEDDLFDLVVAGEIIEHIYDTDFFLSEIRRILKPGGRLLLSTPNIASLGRRLFLLFGKSPIIEDSPNERTSSGHIRYFTFQTLNGLLKKHHLRLISQKADFINFSQDGSVKFPWLAQILPKWGTSIIALAQKE